jgi:protein-disulfide isomerase
VYDREGNQNKKGINMLNYFKLILLIAAAVLITSCSTDKAFKKQLIKTLKENPEIVFQTIKEHPSEFMQTVQGAAQNAQQDMAIKRKQQEENELAKSFEKPLKPVITEKQIYRGTKNAPITIVEYSDFECPFCSRGFTTVEELLKKYDGKIRFVFKHLPLSFHPSAMLSAQYYEAIALQSPKKAFKFHDMIFRNQSKLKKGEAFLTKIAKDLKVDFKRLKKDLNSEKVTLKIDQDIQEAKKFGIQGTPGFVINGIPVKGAYPASHFEKIISKLQAKGKLKL